MKCEKCGKREAVVHKTDIENGSPVETHLCQECYREIVPPMQKTPTLQEILGALLEHVGGEDQKDLAKLACATCGTTYLNFRSSGRLGCPNDYVAFGKALAGILEKLHYGLQHVGKAPRRAKPDLKRDNELVRLRKDLERAIHREDYESAATCRDRIAELNRTSHG